MGMFDEYHAPCPECGADMEWQSKAGPCVLASYGPHRDDIPFEVVQDLDGEVAWCEKCGKPSTLRLKTVVKYVLEPE